MDAQAPQREFKGCPKAAQRPPKGSKMDPTALHMSSIFASMGPKASRRTPCPQKGAKSIQNSCKRCHFWRQKIQKVDAEKVPKTSKNGCKKGAKMKAKTFLNQYRHMHASAQPRRFSVRACPFRWGQKWSSLRILSTKTTSECTCAFWGWGDAPPLRGW